MTEAITADADGPVRLMVVGVAVLVGIDAVGGVVAISADVNTPAEAWGSAALLAAPWPMVVAQVALAGAAYRWRDRRGAVAAGVLSLACLVSAISGFFDGGLGNSRVPDSVAPLQWLLVGATAAVGVLAARVAARLWPRG
jgi:hypothetical protein